MMYSERPTRALRRSWLAAPPCRNSGVATVLAMACTPAGPVLRALPARASSSLRCPAPASRTLSSAWASSTSSCCSCRPSASVPADKRRRTQSQRCPSWCLQASVDKPSMLPSKVQSPRPQTISPLRRRKMWATTSLSEPTVRTLSTLGPSSSTSYTRKVPSAMSTSQRPKSRAAQAAELSDRPWRRSMFTFRISSLKASWKAK
mmetsp:Transcript_97498/g.258962  ORF Transcript_97498/g.258962 Transcript_97498/m.258962 type:complete len:204 (+) Transcript_97498:557-1168(+)